MGKEIVRELDIERQIESDGSLTDRLLGVSSQVLAQSISAVVSGITVTQLRDGIYLIDVVARAEERERISPDALRTLQIPIPNGGTVPLLQLATVEYAQDWPLIWRRDRNPTLTVQSDLVAGVLPATVVDTLRSKVDALNAELPVGYRIVPGGSVEESAKSTSSVAAVVPAALLIIVCTENLNSGVVVMESAKDGA